FSNKFIVLRAAKDGSIAFNTPADAAKAGAVTWNYGNFITLIINFLIVAGAVFLPYPGHESLEATQTPRTGDKGVPRLCDDDPGKGEPLSALHDGIFPTIARVTGL